MLIRINQITRGWTNYFKHAVAQRTFSHLRQFTWWRIVRMMRTRHRWRWKDVRRWVTDPATGRWHPISADGIKMFDAAAVPITRYRYRGNKIPDPCPGCRNQPTAETMESPLRGKPHGGFGERPGETNRARTRHRAPGRLNRKPGFAQFESAISRRSRTSRQPELRHRDDTPVPVEKTGDRSHYLPRIRLRRWSGLSP